MSEWVSLQGVLIAVGLLLDVVGVLLLAAEDLHPVWLWTERRARTAVLALRQTVEQLWRQIGRRPGHVYEKAGTISAGVKIGGDVTGRTVPAANATLEQNVDYLLREAERSQRRLDELERGLRVEREERSRVLHELQVQVARLIDESISASRQRFAILRRFGIAFVIAGSTLLSLANLA